MLSDKRHLRAKPVTEVSKGRLSVYVPATASPSLRRAYKERIDAGHMLTNNKMTAFILCLCIATVVAWPSGVYILDGMRSNQYYNPLAEPHSQLNLNIDLRGDSYRAAENACCQD